MPLVFPDPLVSVTYAVLLVSVICLWLPMQHLWAAALVLAIALGYFAGVLTGLAAFPIALLGIACWLYRMNVERPTIRGLLAIVILATTLVLGMHLVPGFHNAVLAERVVLSPGAAAYTLRLNFDKTAAGILLVGLCYAGLIQSAAEWRDAWRRTWHVIAANIVIVVVLAWVLGYVDVDPKWTSLFVPWAIVNLLFVCVSEEAFFRGFIQRQLSQHLEGRRFGSAIAVMTSAVLFGLAHFGGGFTYVLLSTVAGAGYALAFQRSGRIEMSILAHFSLNAIHFLLFTYPRNA